MDFRLLDPKSDIQNLKFKQPFRRIHRDHPVLNINTRAYRRCERDQIFAAVAFDHQDLGAAGTHHLADVAKQFLVRGGNDLTVCELPIVKLVLAKLDRVGLRYADLITAKWLGRFLWKTGDGRIIDGIGPDGVAARVIDITNRAIKLQTGYIYTYAFVMLVGVALIITYFIFAGGGLKP